MSAAEQSVAQALADNKQPQSLGAIIDRMVVVRDERRTIAARDKVLVDEYEALEKQLLAQMKAQGTDAASSKVATASMSSTPTPTVEDWDAFYTYMRENDSLYLLQKRPAIGAFNELKDAGVTVPGVRFIDIEKISLRAK